jgi:hypothetical protein
MGIKDSYTKPEVDAIIAQASALPVGATVAFPLDKVAPGFLGLDGSVKSIAVYPDLAAFLGTAFNKGDEGAGNFRLPESRGEFLRGWDHGRGIDAGRAIGSAQLGTLAVYDSTSTGASVDIVRGTIEGIQADGYSAADYPGVGLTFTSTNVSYSPNLAGGGVARPRNVAVMWCIKAWNAPINQGNIDVAALAALARQATEIKLGTAKIATQALTDAGVDDATIVTPKKLRWGFQILKGPTGYIVFPSWLGGLILQWGLGLTSAGGAASVALPLLFPNVVLRAFVSASGTNSVATVGVVTTNSIGLNCYSGNTATGKAENVQFFLIGY